MKITWLNPEMTEALVTRGVLWWKRQARLTREFHDVLGGCWFGASNKLDLSLSHEIEIARSRSLDWQPVRPLPKARVIP